MTNYYEIKDDYLSDYRIQRQTSLPDNVSFTTGAFINEPLPEPIVFEVDYPDDVEPPHFLKDVIPIFSSGLLDTLRSAGIDNFQAFPAMLVNPVMGKQWTNYWALNIIGIISAADMDSSDYDLLMAGDPGGVDIPLAAFRTIVLDSQALPNEPMLFRLAECPHVIMAREDIINAIKQNRPSEGWGFKIHKTEVH